MIDSTSHGSSLSNRAVSGFAISIATSMALESIFAPRQKPYDPSRPIPQRIDINKYQEIWINLFTLFRNISGAVDKEVFVSAAEEELKDVLLFELEIIESLFQVEGSGFCKPRFYFCTYDDLYLGRVNKFVKVRHDKTEYQKIFKAKLMKTMDLLVKERSDLFMFNTEIETKQRTNSLILTHVPHDYTSFHRFSKLDLLESHTGVLKPRYVWYTKYYPVGDMDLSHIPFHKKLLFIFGDKVLIQPMDIRLRRQIVDLAKRRQWTQLTTITKVDFDFNLDIKEPFVLEVLRSL